MLALRIQAIFYFARTAPRRSTTLDNPKLIKPAPTLPAVQK